MLCPECRQSAPGGTPCPRCGSPVPARESFGGEGAHYLRLFTALSLVSGGLFCWIASRGTGLTATLGRLAHTAWLWLYLLLLLAPIGVGLYYYAMLRAEEVIVTDAYIERRSKWGNQRLAWSEIRAFRQHSTLLRFTRLGRVAGLSRFFRRGKLMTNLPPIVYELVGPPGPSGDPWTIRLEPGTIEDLPWLLQLIEEHLGPPQEG